MPEQSRKEGGLPPSGWGAVLELAHRAAFWIAVGAIVIVGSDKLLAAFGF